MTDLDPETARLVAEASSALALLQCPSGAPDHVHGAVASSKNPMVPLIGEGAGTFRCDACGNTTTFQWDVTGAMHGRVILSPDLWDLPDVDLPPEDRRWCVAGVIWVGSDCGGRWFRVESQDN